MKSRLNPLLGKFDTPPFDIIEIEDYKPAIEFAIEKARERVAGIVDNSDIATFENSVEALEFCSAELDQVTAILFNLNHAATSNQMQQLCIELSPIITSFSNDISLNPQLFERVKYVYDNSNLISLSEEQSSLLEKSYIGFVRSGALLEEPKKEEYRKITEELSTLSLKFSQNVLNATNDFELHITKESELDGLPNFVREMAKSEAIAKDKDGWLFTLAFQSFMPFMQYSNIREYRELMWRKYNSRAFEGDKNDNKENVIRIVELRILLAKLLGYQNYAQYALERRMAKTQSEVEGFINDLISQTKPFFESDMKDISNFAKESGFEGDVMAWDFAYYAEKYKSKLYTLSDDKLKPYFKLESVESGLFDIITRLYNISFEENFEIAKYHEDAKVYDVVENGAKIATFFVDYFPRESKMGGAWMTSFEDKCEKKGYEKEPVISVVCNFSKPTVESPSLLTFNEVTTMFHEFGHALHGIFATGNYPSIGGTNVARDFVELPSQILENWASDSEFLAKWAKHYQTGEVIPAEYIEKIKASENFMSGYAQMRQLTFASCDMAWHTLSEIPKVGVREFEIDAIAPTQLGKSDTNICISTAFSHIFAGGYAAGYYSYKWAEVLEADAFESFQEVGIYNKECAKSFRDNILSMGSKLKPMELYINFKGRKPSSSALFKKLGLVYEK